MTEYIDGFQGREFMDKKARGDISSIYNADGIPLSKFPRLENETDDTSRFTRAFEKHSTVVLDSDVSVSYINIPDNCKLICNGIYTINTTGTIALGYQSYLLGNNLSIEQTSYVENMKIVSLSKWCKVVLYQINGYKLQNLKQFKGTSATAIHCQYSDFVQVDILRSIKYCKIAFYIKSGASGSGNTINRSYFNCAWIGDCYKCFVSDESTSIMINTSAYMEQCTIGYELRAGFYGHHEVRFDHVDNWFINLLPEFRTRMGDIYLRNVKMSELLQQISATRVNVDEEYDTADNIGIDENDRFFMYTTFHCSDGVIMPNDKDNPFNPQIRSFPTSRLIMASGLAKMRMISTEAIQREGKENDNDTSGGTVLTLGGDYSEFIVERNSDKASVFNVNKNGLVKTRNGIELGNATLGNANLDIKKGGVIYGRTPDTNAKNNMIFVNSSNNKLQFKDNSGIIHNISTDESIMIQCGKKLESDTSDAERIQRAIDSSSMGDIIKFPSENVIIDKTINLKPYRNYLGAGWGTTIKAADNANLAEMISLPHTANNYRTIIDGIMLDGNKDNNGATTGLYIGSLVNGIIRNVFTIYCGGTGIYMNGQDKFRSNTTNIINCRANSCNGYGLYISEYCEDMHVLQGDYGSNKLDGIHLKSPSSSIRDVTVWGNMQNGIYVDANAVSGQIWNSQIEGNAQIGLFLNASFFYVCGNKIYDNANIPDNYGKFDGIYVNAYEAYKDSPIEGISIIGNKVYSGLYDNTGIQRFALSIDKYHKNFSIYANDFFYQGNGSIDKTRSFVNGINDTDKSDFNWINSFLKLNLSSDQSIVNSTLTKLKFNKIVTDVDGNFNMTSEKIIVKDSGYYEISCNVHIDNCILDTYNYIQYTVNNVVKSRIAGGYGGNAKFLSLTGCDTVYLEKDDYIEVFFYSNKDVTINSIFYLTSLTFRKV